MKKILAIALALVLAFTFVGCDGTENVTDDTQAEVVDIHAKSEGVMTYAEYAAAELQAEVVVETFVQAKQSWWENKATIYTQDLDGGYFIYEMPCTEDEFNKMTPGTKIRVKGYKAEFDGEVEIADVTSVEILDGNWVAEPMDATALLGTDELINHMNKLCTFNGLTVEAIEYKNGEPGDDIYLTLGLNGASYSFCVEIYLTGADSEVYTTVASLAAGDTVDVEAFLYWYQGANPHITKITKK